jgi:YjbE family integral membrane protein
MSNDLAAFGQVVLVDLVLAGDNAIIIGALAASLPDKQRRAAVMFGVLIAVIARIALSLGVVALLNIPGIMIVGGILLLWVAWKMWSDLQGGETEVGHTPLSGQSLRKAIFSIALADISMSLDNVLGVAGAANGHIGAMVFGLVLSVALMGVAASIIAKVINKHRWIAYAGLAMILFIAARMIWHGIEVLV